MVRVLVFLSQRQISGVEHIAAEVYSRTVEVDHSKGQIAAWISVKNVPERHSVEITVPLNLAPVIGRVLCRVNRLFDLGARPDLIDAQLGYLAAGLPGMRVPDAFDGIEIAVRAVVGQQISVANARAILSRIASRYGTAIAEAPDGLATTFPSGAILAQLPMSALVSVGMTGIRAEAIIALAQGVAARRIVLEGAKRPRLNCNRVSARYCHVVGRLRGYCHEWRWCTDRSMKGWGNRVLAQLF